MARKTDPPASDDLDLERELDRLFRSPLDGFVDARNALAAALRKAGRRDDADRVKATAKPSVTAWAVNQVWWTDRRAFEDMLDAGTRLRDAQRASLQGEAGQMRDAVETRQAAIGTVVDLAVRAMGGSDRVGPPMRQRLGATCDALSTGDVPPGTRLGRLTEDLQPAGFGALSGMLALAASAPTPLRQQERTETRQPATVTQFRARSAPAAPAAKSPTVESPQERKRREAEERTRAARAKAKLAVDEADAVIRDAEATVAALREAAGDADAAHQAARQRVAAAEKELEAAREAESETRIMAANARRDAAAANVELTRARRAAEKVRAQFVSLGG